MLEENFIENKFSISSEIALKAVIFLCYANALHSNMRSHSKNVLSCMATLIPMAIHMGFTANERYFNRISEQYDA